MNQKEDWPISGINMAVTKIEELSEEDISLGDASGFFFRDDNWNKYLITNRHVVINEKRVKYPKKIRISTHNSTTDKQSNFEIIISLYKDDKSLWLEHPLYKENGVDIVLIPLNNNTMDELNFSLFNSSIINFFSKENFLEDIEISTFANVLIVGYPLGFYDRKNNLPIYRKGMIASSYPHYFENKPFFLIDANLHNGTSGSPVLNHNGNVLIKDGISFHSNMSYLLGIHSSEAYEQDKEDNDVKKPLGLCAVWYSSNILDILNSIKK